MATLSWNEIKSRALAFSKEWQGEERERAEKDTFWNDFFNVFGMSRRRVATFEEPVKKLNHNIGFIDLFWKGHLLVEHKSQGKNLDAAFEQATDYFAGIKEEDLPRYILVSDFARFKLYDLEEKTEVEFPIENFHKEVKRFGFIAGYEKREFKEQDPVNIKAAELMGKIHDQLEEHGYTGHALEVYLVRLLFCLFADDTGIFERDTFKEYIELKTNEDGSDLGAQINTFFHVLNTPKDKRMTTLDEHLAAFPYINGKLFEEPLPPPSFTSAMREQFLECCALDWGKISPAIFGSMFQSVMKPEERRNLGAHYTSEKNILKVIEPLFLDELKEKFEKVKNNKRQLQQFHQELSQLKFLDPACGCGNFLLIAYRELRMLELEIIKKLHGTQQATNIEGYVLLNVDQFYGIEYDEFPARIAEVAMWLMDHQMNMIVSEFYGAYFMRLPLRTGANIVHANALRIDWESVVPKKELNYIMGNPPFLGHHLQTKEQKSDLVNVLKGIKASGVMDYVSGWFYLAAKYIQNTEIVVGLVSTNSLAQGEQVSILYDKLLNTFKIKILFAHRTFKWNNEARGNAAVHVVITGFGLNDRTNKIIYDYENINSEPQKLEVKNINPYIVDAENILIYNRSNPICSVPPMKMGSKPTDGGFFLFSDEEMNEFILKEPQSKKFFRKYISAKDFLNSTNRFCLWLAGIPPNELANSPLVLKQIEKVKRFRQASIAKSTREYPHHALFRQVTQPNSDYILIPSTTSERRKYIPIGYISQEVIISNASYAIENCGLFEFGTLTSLMHMAWVKYTCGRLKSDFRYSKDLVYNNYPWPKEPSDKNKQAVEEKAQTVLETRAKYLDSSLADLYDPLTMAPDLVKAHNALDKAVDLCYRPQPFTTESARIEYLFELYAEYTQPLLKGEKKKKKK